MTAEVAQPQALASGHLKGRLVFHPISVPDDLGTATDSLDQR
ncbi:hypothetical protein KCH_71390 [Kitasatospora cheerisanensis KCTC 2395]|uniref:Uncharacterized protein n=1 Tax=Kitasatospora cheerisanensis KCTC 2395 TaxID=1348663 RepID=A0A066YSY5_9ACTN|nr:hypothetical protein KCH_71390 [Kitasatospora cheerisanensis KCTC 2395]